MPFLSVPNTGSCPSFSALSHACATRSVFQLFREVVPSAESGVIPDSVPLFMVTPSSASSVLSFTPSKDSGIALPSSIFLAVCLIASAVLTGMSATAVLKPFLPSALSPDFAPCLNAAVTASPPASGAVIAACRPIPVISPPR